MNQYIALFKYTLLHKWYVFLACHTLGITWSGIVHDLDKFLPNRFIPYANHFYNKDGTRCAELNQDDAVYNYAWLLHQKANKHHWEWWVLLGRRPHSYTVLPMYNDSVKEMLADWYGASKAKGHNDFLEWWEVNQHKISLHPDTRKQIEEYVSVIARKSP